MEKNRIINFEEWELAFNPIEIDGNLPLGGIVVDNFDDLPKVDLNYIWTWVNGENESDWIIPGKHYVNRLGYIATNVPYDPKSNIQVDLNDYMRICDAKYECLSFIKDILNIELTDKQNNLLHEYWSNF